MQDFPKTVFIAYIYPANAKINQLREKPIMHTNLHIKSHEKM